MCHLSSMVDFSIVVRNDSSPNPCDTCVESKNSASVVVVVDEAGDARIQSSLTDGGDLTGSDIGL